MGVPEHFTALCFQGRERRGGGGEACTPIIHVLQQYPCNITKATEYWNSSTCVVQFEPGGVRGQVGACPGSVALRREERAGVCSQHYVRVGLPQPA